MSIEAVGFISPSVPLAPFDGPQGMRLPGTSSAQAQGGFAQWFTQQVEHVNGRIAESDQQLQALATGEAQNLHQVMISLEEARLSFQLLAQVRNRVLEAYQDVMRMQL
jgi:flagellar hook-basal body complex protein FliE